MRTILYSEIQKERCNAAALGMYSAYVGALQVYQGTAFDGINNELRYDIPDRYKKIIDNMENFTDETKETLYRGLDHNFLLTLKNEFKINDINNIDELQKKLVGKSIKDKGFSSTTRNLHTAAYFSRDTGKGKTAVMQIDGTKKGSDIQKRLKQKSTKNEGEFLLKRNSSLKIKRVTLSKTGKVIIYTEA